MKFPLSSQGLYTYANVSSSQTAPKAGIMVSIASARESDTGFLSKEIPLALIFYKLCNRAHIP